MDDKGLLVRLNERYLKAAHRVQTAIGFLGGKRIEPKHMRTGIDLSKSDMGGLVTLLIEKGIFTETEYVTAIVNSAEKEADIYEDELSIKTGVNVKTY